MATHPNTPPPDLTENLQQGAWTSLQPTPFVPMGFGSQIRALSEAIKKQADRIDALETVVTAKNTKIEEMKQDVAAKEKKRETIEKDATEKDAKIATLEDKIQTLERINEERAASRRAAVSYLQGLKFPLKNQETVTAFCKRTYPLRLDDFEGQVTAYAAIVSAILNDEPSENWYQPPLLVVPPACPYPILGPAVPPNPAITYVSTPVPMADYQTPGYDYNGYTSTTTPMNCAPHNNPIPCEICRGW